MEKVLNKFIFKKYHISYEPDFLESIKNKDSACLEGYWQSENYFKDVETIIRTDLEIEPPKDLENLAVAAKIIHSLSVAVHVRFFDTPQDSKSINNISSDYYSQAISKMDTLAPGAHYFVFSDQPEAARGKIPLPDSRITCVAHNQGDVNAYADLWLMTLCKHFIIANSTFSWWGAWLAAYKGKYIIAPGLKKSSGKSCWGFKGLLPDSWIRL